MPVKWVTQLLRQGDAKVFKKYSQMKPESLIKLKPEANEIAGLSFGTVDVLGGEIGWPGIKELV